MAAIVFGAVSMSSCDAGEAPRPVAGGNTTQTAPAEKPKATVNNTNSDLDDMIQHFDGGKNKTAEDYWILAELYKQNNQNTQAMQTARAAIGAITPANAIDNYYVSKLHAINGNTAKATEHFNTALQAVVNEAEGKTVDLRGKDANYFYRLGLKENGKQKLSNAVVLHEKAIKLNAKYPLYHNALGGSLRFLAARQSDKSKSRFLYRLCISEYSRAISLDQGDPLGRGQAAVNLNLTTSYLGRGLAHKGLADNGSAILDFKESQKHDDGRYAKHLTKFISELEGNK